MNVRTATARYLIHLEEIGQGTVYYMNSVSRELYASKCYPCMTGILHSCACRVAPHLKSRNRNNLENLFEMPNKAQEDAVINLKSIQDIAKQLGFEWTIIAYELGLTRAEVRQFHAAAHEKKAQAQKMLECWYERSWNKLNKTKLLQDALERAGRKDLADKLRCLHWGHQKLSNRVELPSAFPFLITVHKTINNRDGLKKINELSRRYT